MNNNTRIALAGLLSAAGAALNAFASELDPSKPAEVTAETPAAAKQKRTPKAEKSATALTPAAETAVTATEAAAETTTEETKAKTYEELKAMIKPLVENAQGPDVKKVIAKYAVNLQELATKPEHHAAFETDLAALSY